MKTLWRLLVSLGFVLGIGSNVLDAITGWQMGLPTSAWTAIAFVLLGGGLVIWQMGERHISSDLIDRLEALPKARESSVVVVKNGAPSKPKERWKGFTEVEVAQLLSARRTMLLHHGHVDGDGLADDLKNGRPLNGNCWLCRKPRFERGEPLSFP